MALGIFGLLVNTERVRRVENWVEQIIHEIKEVEGIQGVFLLNTQGEVLYPLNPSEHPLSACIRVAGMDIVQALAIFELTGNPLQEVQLDFTEGVLLIYDQLGLQVKTAQGLEDACLVVPCLRSVNRPHLRMVMKVAMTKVQNHQKGARGRLGASAGKQASLDPAKVDPALHKYLDTVRGA